MFESIDQGKLKFLVGRFNRKADALRLVLRFFEFSWLMFRVRQFVRLVGLFGIAFSIIAFGDMLTWARWWCLWICPSRCGTSLAQRRSVRTAFRLNFRGSQGSLLRGGVGLWVFLTRLDKYFPLLAALRVTCTCLDRPSAVFILRKKEVGYWSVRSAKSQRH